jgi:hypothetical protein
LGLSGSIFPPLISSDSVSLIFFIAAHIGFPSCNYNSEAEKPEPLNGARFHSLVSVFLRLSSM